VAGWRRARRARGRAGPVTPRLGENRPAAIRRHGNRLRRRRSTGTGSRGRGGSPRLPHAASSSGTTSAGHDIARDATAIHGGLRYLEHGEVGLVYESLGERENAGARGAAPRTARCGCWCPCTGDDRRPPWMVRAGLVMSRRALVSGKSLPRHRRDAARRRSRRRTGAQPRWPAAELHLLPTRRWSSRNGSSRIPAGRHDGGRPWQ